MIKFKSFFLGKICFDFMNTVFLGRFAKVPLFCRERREAKTFIKLLLYAILHSMVGAYFYV